MSSAPEATLEGLYLLAGNAPVALGGVEDPVAGREEGLACFTAADGTVETDDEFG